jgi:uncharacterized damage-inducible protein DinB
MGEWSRPRPGRVGDERAQLASVLDLHRATLLEKVAGMTEEQVRHSPVASGTSLLGLIAHLTKVEAWWFRGVLDGQKVDPPAGDDDPDAGWLLAADHSSEDVCHAYRAAVARSRMVLSRHELDEIVTEEGRRLNARWIVLHMIEETARHNGRADIIRELIDGAVDE